MHRVSCVFHCSFLKRHIIAAYFRTCWINPLCRSIRINKDQISGIDPNVAQERLAMIFIEPHFGSISEIWSLLIRIDRHRGLIWHVLIFQYNQKYMMPVNICKQMLTVDSASWVKWQTNKQYEFVSLFSMFSGRPLMMWGVARRENRK